MLAVHRDPAVVASGVERWLAARRRITDLAVTRCDRPSGGLSSETLMVEARGTRGAIPYAESLVVRLAPAGAGIFPEYDLAVQARAQEAAAAGGVPTAVPVEVEPDPDWLGAPFLVMPAIEGHVPGSMPVRDPWITDSVDGAAHVSERLYDLLVTLHGIDWRSEALDTRIPVRDLDAELAYWRRYLDWYGDGEVIVPALVDALDWCAAHQPAHEPPLAFLWGDVRLGNVIFDEARRPAAVLDWEMTTIGAPEHDLAWQLTLEATQNELFGRAVPGFLDRDTACARYEAGAGRSLQDLEWFEVLAMVRSIAIMSRLAHLQERAGTPPMLPIADNPLLDLLAGRRVAASAR
jgi:aminoglycoside phosphotransferase (APT) family kinase protein